MTAATPLGDIDASVIQALLHNFGWRLEFAGSQPYEIWTREDSTDEILMPADSNRGDYAQLLNRAYRSLIAEHGAEIEKSAHFLVLQNRSMLDATRWMKETPISQGLISWELGESVYAVAKSALSAAAKASKESRKYYGNAASYVAKKFLEGTLMGQTEIGSFVVTAYTPTGRKFFFSKSSEEASASQLVSVQSCSGADIIDKLDEVLSGVRGMLDEYKNLPRDEMFDELVPIGLSYEMSHALSTLSAGGDGAISISRVSSPKVQSYAKEYAFESVESAILARVANRFSITREPEPVTLVGEVTLLDRVSTAEENTVRLHVSNQPSIRTVRIRLTPEDYEVAIDAHKSDVPLRVTGLVEAEGRYNWIYRPSSVSAVVSVTNDDEIPDDPETSSAQDALF